MEIERLKTFLSVAQYGSFQKAAQRAFLSQRAVSKRITAIEQELGVTLFDRGRNRITLTSEGRLFLSSAQDIVNSYTNTVAEIQQVKQSSPEVLRVGYFSAFEQQLLQNAIFKMLQDNPRMQVIIKEGSNEHLTRMVKNGDLDLALSINYGQPSVKSTAQLQTKAIFSETMVMGVSTLNPLSKQTALASADIKDVPILYYSSESSTFLLESFLASFPFIQDYEQIRRVASVEQMNILVALNKAFAFYPEGLIPSTLKNDHIRFLPFADKSTQSYTIDAVYKNVHLSHTLKRLLTELCN